MDRGAEASWVPCQSLRRPSHRDGVNTPAQSTTPCRSSARSCRRSGSSCRCLSLLPLSGSPASAPRPRRIRELLQPSDPSRYSRAPRPQNFPPPTGYGTRPGGCPAPALRQGTPAVRGLAGAGGRGRRRTARPEAGALARTTGEDRPIDGFHHLFMPCCLGSFPGVLSGEEPWKSMETTRRIIKQSAVDVLGELVFRRVISSHLTTTCVGSVVVDKKKKKKKYSVLSLIDAPTRLVGLTKRLHIFKILFRKIKDFCHVRLHQRYDS